MADPVHQPYWKVEAQVKAEIKRVCSTLNLNLDLSLPRSAILRAVLLLSQTCGPLNLKRTLKQLVADLTLDEVILQEQSRSVCLRFCDLRETQ
jgi:hypothetical protein